MFKIKSATRLAITVGVGCASTIWLAIGLGLVPDPNQLEIQHRVALTKSIAVNVTTFAENKRTTDLTTILNRIVAADEELVSIGIKRHKRSEYLITAGPHRQQWNPRISQNPGRQIKVQVLANGKTWGDLEIAFQPTSQAAFGGWWAFPGGLIAFISSATVLLTWVVLSKTFKYLNPSRVVPDRVRSALDTLAEGLVLITPSGEVAHANQAFSEIVRLPEESVLGLQLEDFGWIKSENQEASVLPWKQCLLSQERVCGEIVQLKVPNTPTLKFVINATPIFSQHDHLRGVLVSFDDVTALENKNAELGRMIHTLRHSRDEVERQNEKLNFLASYDPMTSCMNRRAFFERFEDLWKRAPENHLTVMMLDVDHFKQVNDNHGHSVGDEVLKTTGLLMRNIVGRRGMVCRYGGEEFAILVPEHQFEECIELANQVRVAIESTEANGIRFTVSIGISCREFGAMDPQHMLDQADECLYTAKRHGRNQVVRFDEQANYEDREQEDVGEEIPYSAVTGLLSALSFRCRTTAEHSIRVADLCVAIGEKMMSRRELYQLEIAALLHDIGKIGVSDSILKKPGPLTPEELRLMRRHDAMGVEIVRSAFASEAIAAAIESHHFERFDSQAASFAANGKQIPLAARIINVCDAFDSMTHDRIYRKSIGKFEALEEITKHSPSQFDPEVVTRLLAYVHSGFHQTQSTLDAPSLRAAVAVGKRIEELNSAVANKNMERIRLIVNQLKLDVDSSDAFSAVTARLDLVVNSANQGDDELISIAKEVMELCRSTRSTFIKAAEAVNAD